MFAYWFDGLVFWTCVTINQYEISIRKPAFITVSVCEIYEHMADHSSLSLCLSPVNNIL